MPSSRWTASGWRLTFSDGAVKDVDVGRCWLAVACSKRQDSSPYGSRAHRDTRVDRFRGADCGRGVLVHPGSPRLLLARPVVAIKQRLDRTVIRKSPRSVTVQGAA
jgi:hypothetical protein